jgi:Zn-dependent protease
VAKAQGRISLNPLRHLSLLGTLAIFILGFGWGKPVPVNLYNFKRPKRDYLLCSLAGPASNVILCGLAYGLLHLSLSKWAVAILISIAIVNAILAVVNLIPIPPLDGSKIWPCLIPGLRPAIGGNLSRLGFVVLLVALYTGAIGKVVHPTINWLGGALFAVIDDTRTYTERPEGFPSSLAAPADACDITYTVYPTHGDNPPDYSLDYIIEHPYPCASLIAEIGGHIETMGWRRTSHAIHDPNITTVNPWTATGEEGRLRHRWSGSWIAPGDRWLSLFITNYSDPNEPNTPAWTYVDMYLDGPGSEDVDTYWEYRQRYPHEFEFSPVATQPE